MGSTILACNQYKHRMAIINHYQNLPEWTWVLWQEAVNTADSVAVGLWTTKSWLHVIREDGEAGGLGPTTLTLIF